MTTAYDTDVLTELLLGTAAFTGRARAIPATAQAVPVVAASEVLRGWLAAVRLAAAGKGKMTLSYAFDRFEHSLVRLAAYPILPYPPTADARFKAWRRAGIRVGTNDLQIAAICVDHGAKLATRNARDFAQVPGLNYEVWP